MARFTVQGAVKLPFSSEPGNPSAQKLAKSRFLENQLLQIPQGSKKRVGRSCGSYLRVWSVGSKKPSSSSSHRAEEEFSEDEDNIAGSGGDGEDEFDGDELSCFRGLVLDISYRPVNVVCWRRAICLEFMEKADVLEYYDQTVSSPSGPFSIPAVLRVPNLLQVVKKRRIKQTLCRKSILFRDHYTCQYCSSRDNLTIDHVLPISRGGEWKWENLVTACAKCNSRKGQKTLEEAKMKLIKIPKAMKDFDILAIPLTSSTVKSLKMKKKMPEEWRQYLPKPSLET